MVLWFGFGIYLLAMFAIAFAAYRFQGRVDDYVLGGRRLGATSTALSAGASDMSGWLLLGLPGFAYAAGVEALWLVLGLLVGSYLNWRLLATRLRIYSVELADASTIPTFLARRFDRQKVLLRAFAGSIILLFFLFYSASGLVAGGRLFETAFAVPYHQALLLGAGIIVAYTLLGGFIAVSWTDVAQGLLMLTALMLVPVLFLWQSEQGWGEISAAQGAFYNDFFLQADGDSLGWIGIVSLLGWGLGYFGQPHILARFKAVSDSRLLTRARRIAITWSLLAMLAAFAVGVLGHGLPQATLGGEDVERVFMLLVEALFHPLIAGLLLAAIMAAIMSTVDSQLLVAASVVSRDLPRTKPLPLWLSRMVIVLIALLAVMIAWQPESKVLDLVAYAWAGLGASFGPLLLLSLFWRRLNHWGALAAIATGAATVVVWKPLSGGWFDVYELVPGFLFSALAAVAVSLLTPPPVPRVQAQFASVSVKLHASAGDAT